MAEHRLRLRAERGKDELRTKLAQVGEQQRELRALCEACAAEQAAVRVAELETKASISRHCAAVGRELASREHEAQSAVARAEATERGALGRHSRAAGVRREALAEAVAHGAAALSLPDGRDFIARGLSAIALLDAELAVPPGDAHAAIGAAAAPPIQGLLSGHPEPGSAGGSRRICRLACAATGHSSRHLACRRRRPTAFPKRTICNPLQGRSCCSSGDAALLEDAASA
jgi:hypothetical protein